MTEPRDTDPHVRARAALERLWTSGQRLAAAWRDRWGTLPIPLEDLAASDGASTAPVGAALSELEQTFVDAYLFRLAATVETLVDGAIEAVLRSAGQMLFLDSSEDIRGLAQLGAIPSADQLLAIREQAGQHHRIPTLAPGEQAEVLNTAWADGREVLDILVHLSRHLQETHLIPGLQPFNEAPEQ